jgi:hypothetical protein
MLKSFPFIVLFVLLGCQPQTSTPPVSAAPSRPPQASQDTAERLRSQSPTFTGTERERKLKEELYWNFGVPGYSTSWYPHILDVKINEADLTTVSDLPRGHALLKAIGQCLSFQIYANGSGLPQKLLIVDQQGQELLVRRSISDQFEIK